MVGCSYLRHFSSRVARVIDSWRSLILCTKTRGYFLPEVSDNYQAIDVATSVVAVPHNALHSIAVVVLTLLNHINSKTSIAKNSKYIYNVILAIDQLTYLLHGAEFFLRS